MSFDVYKIRQDFPVLHQQVYNKPLVYFDNGATTQKPMSVIEATRDFLQHHYSSIHRGVHHLSERATQAYEQAREKVREYIGAASAREVIFTSGTTASINTVAYSFGESFVTKGDEIVISQMEHHANIVPWQMLCQRKGAILRTIPFDAYGVLNLQAFDSLLNERTRLVSITHASNVLGTINDIREIIRLAHARNIPVLIDAAQSVQHETLNVQELDCDFLVFSGHKIYGPTGIGVLYGKEKWLDAIPPWQGGGDMVDVVTFEKTTYNELPFKFEAGTTNFCGAIGLGYAIDYLMGIGLNAIARHEQDLLEYATRKMLEIEGVRIFGQAPQKGPIISFLVDNIHQYDTGMILDKMGIAVRTGTHCAQPLMKILGIEGTVRASMAFYNTFEEIDRLAEGILKVKHMFR